MAYEGKCEGLPQPKIPSAEDGVDVGFAQLHILDGEVSFLLPNSSAVVRQQSGRGATWRLERLATFCANNKSFNRLLPKSFSRSQHFLDQFVIHQKPFPICPN